MARLFLTPREVNFISDITKELIKDVNGQKVYLYPISEHKTLTHGVYDEAVKKVFDNPIIIDALVDNNFQTDTKIDLFGIDSQYKIEVYIQYRDLVEKGININIGDFFSFSDVFYEITERAYMRNIYGMPEHKDGIKIMGTKARDGQFKAPILGPTDIVNTDRDAVQTTFYQQRGQSENAEGKINDSRTLQQNGTLEQPLTTNIEVSPKGDPIHGGAAFYDEL